MQQSEMLCVRWWKDGRGVNVMWRSTKEVGRRSARPKLGSSPPQILWRGNLHSSLRAVASSKATLSPPDNRPHFSTVGCDLPKILTIAPANGHMVIRLYSSFTGDGGDGGALRRACVLELVTAAYLPGCPESDAPWLIHSRTVEFGGWR